MNRIPKGWVSGIAFGLLLGTMVAAVAEDITLTTYYPSPRGVYQTLRSTGQTTLAEAGGNVGIGTAAPTTTLHVVGSARITGVLQLEGGGPSADRILTSDASGNATWRDPGTVANIVTGGGTVNRIPRWTAADELGDSEIFQSAGTNIGIGTTAPSEKLHVVGNIFATGTISVPSDARFKRDVVPLTGALAKLDGLQAISFERNALAAEALGEPASGKRELGLLGQELEEVYPELVTRTGPEAYRAVDYSRLTVVLLEAIKEQQRQIEALQQELEGQRQQLQTQQRELERQREQLEALKVRLPGDP